MPTDDSARVLRNPNLLDGIVPLCFSEFKASLCDDVSHRGTHIGTLTLAGTLALLLYDSFSITLLVLAAVQHSPVNLARVSLAQMSLLRLPIDEGEGLKSNKTS